MFIEEQKIWIVKEMAASRSPINVKRNFFKTFALKGRKKHDYQERRCRKICYYFEKYGDIKRQNPKRLSKKMPVAKVLVGKEIEKNCNNLFVKLQESLICRCRTLKMKLHIKPCIFHQAQDLTIEHKRQRLEFLR